ncbi:MAG: mercury resistance system transport protein MerF [Alphaproteobacteria bacterium]|nr:mercury resistance system transport protein MerF [Alphaproteobacteria bacterium]MDE2112897.1 mercury resistance system transport protein MerF [Alphaproteobacteria bacterium]MDE2495651.1 mercury resistance system transport protein MerF [Alphaproteobacteria bacterium]
MNKRWILGGIVGSTVAALCCFTPLLVVLFGALGLSAWLGWADYVVIPAFAFFVLLTAYAIYRRKANVGAASGVACPPHVKGTGD